ncbi:MarR family winged helix-turn-helix transcriptional regulator [Novosphingobium sediminicola]|uniref:DNA-binding MarR family transcriptional regulator n=1 Tax=Novosphingobium sediminicola TaxID=563162 RepID=A0A7W6CDK9_9SPHN|nr:MarR family transcriptional regulator [Novosphingobium sediminicola]MBB3953867.1 DNA-binding MarR family transcriptional regulator [Novosphingobium sediminicola]
MMEEGAERRLELRVWIRLLDCAKLVEKQLRRNFQDQFDTTLPRFDVLAALDRAPDGLTMGEISRALLVSNGNVTSIVRQLSEQGIIDSRPDPNDRRAAIVSMTAQGREYFKTLADAHSRWVHEALSCFPADHQAHLLTLLDQLKTSIRAQ